MQPIEKDDDVLAAEIVAFKETYEREQQLRMRPDRYKAVKSGASKRRKIEGRRVRSGGINVGRRWHVFDGTSQMAKFVGAGG
jgi:hypothetical protein